MSQSKFLCPFRLRVPPASVISVFSVAKNILLTFDFFSRERYNFAMIKISKKQTASTVPLKLWKK
jgi:hypothetical protein